MDHSRTKYIWPKDTGIVDLPRDWRSLGASEIDGIRKIWSEQRERLKGTKQLSEFTERLSREWAIETGIIENLYEIDRGVTQTLIERGFQAELLAHGSTNQPRDYVLQLLKDQKAALDGVFDFISQRRELSTSYIKELHAALLQSQTHTDAVDALGRSVTIPVTRVIGKFCPTRQRGKELCLSIARPSKSHRKWTVWWPFTLNIDKGVSQLTFRLRGFITGLLKSILSKMEMDVWLAP
jgi:hypothetical protein